MRIAITADQYYPTLNGVSVFSRNLATGLARRGHQVIVIAPSQTGMPYEEIDDGEDVKTIARGKSTPKNYYRIYRIKAKPFAFYRNQTDEDIIESITSDKSERARWRGIWKGIKIRLPKVYDKGFMLSLAPAKEVVEILDGFKPEIIHNQQMLMIGHYIPSYARKNNIPIMTTNHLMPDNLTNNLKMPKLVEKAMISSGNALVRSFLARFDFATMPTQLAIDAFYDEEDSAILPMQAVSNGIDLKLFKPKEPDAGILQKYGFKPSDKIVSFVGRFDKEKHIPILMEAFSKMKTDAKLLLVGDGDELANLQNVAEKLKINDRTVFIGRVSRKELAGLHRLASVFAMPSPVELQSIATLEAMASGKPVVAVDAGALPELIDGNGIIVPADDVAKMSSVLDKILSDDDARKKMGERSLEIAKTHELSKTIEKFEEIYRGLTKEKPKTGVMYGILSGVGIVVGAVTIAVGNGVNKIKPKNKK